jgi:dipeptidyl aminopeptidase/acylaminoacyl peptidase
MSLSVAISNLRRLLALACVLAVGSCTALAQTNVITPGKNIEAVGVPPIPSSLAKELDPYKGQYGLPLAGWNPSKREVWLKGVSSVTWVSRVLSPAFPPLPSFYIRESGIYDIYFQAQGKYLAYTRDAAGNEIFDLYLYDMGGGNATLLSDGKSRSTEPVWSNAGNKIVYSSTPTNGVGVNLRILDRLDPKADRPFVQSSGTYLKAYDWSPDDKQIVYCDFSSNTTASVWLVDVASGNKTLISPKSDQPEFYDDPQFGKDGKGVYVVTDHDSDMRRLAYIDLATRKIIYIPSDPKWDVDEFRLAPDGRILAYVTNEDGISRLHLFDVVAAKERPAQQLPIGIISDPKWNNDSTEVAFNLKSPQSPNDVYSVNSQTGKAELWAKSVTNGIDASKFSQAELIHWSSFDGRTIAGFLYRPPTNFAGKRPVIIDIHGGPDEQYRPAFAYDENYLINVLGVAKIYPNVRGSTGYGKTFAHLDDGQRREDAVKDIGSLLDWIKTQPYLDSNRVMIKGGSYGGYLALSAAYVYSDRIRGTIADSAITSLLGDAEHTDAWRRDIERLEFGDERDPKLRQFMERTAPVSNADKITKPLLIFQGGNDPRVPVSEASNLVAATKKRVPIWYVLAKDEGHGFTRPANRDYEMYATILFVKEFLLKTDQQTSRSFIAVISEQGETR